MTSSSQRSLGEDLLFNCLWKPGWSQKGEGVAQVQGTWSRQAIGLTRDWQSWCLGEPQVGSSLQSQGEQSRVGVRIRLFTRHQETQGWGEMEAGVRLRPRSQVRPEVDWACGASGPPTHPAPPPTPQARDWSSRVPGPGAEEVHSFPETAHRSWSSAGVRTCVHVLSVWLGCMSRGCGAAALGLPVCRPCRQSAPEFPYDHALSPLGSLLRL